MSELIYIRPFNSVHDHISCSRGVAMELHEHFSFLVPNAQYDPRVKSRKWDGYIRLYSLNTSLLYAGLRPRVEEFARARDYLYNAPPEESEFSLIEAAADIQAMDLPLQPRDYQVEAFIHCIRKNRALVVSPTASGKSLLAHMLLKHYMRLSLIIVPSINLVEQMAKNLHEFGWSGDSVDTIYSEAKRRPDAPVTISTWQSLMRAEDLTKFEVVIGDEAHGFKAKELKGIMERLTTTRYRFGLTGTLDGTLTNKLVLEGLFGPVYQNVQTHELISNQTLASLRVKIIVLGHSEETRQVLAGMRRVPKGWEKNTEAKKRIYRDEQDIIISSVPRNRFLCNLAASLKGNTILLFHFVEKHGRALHAQLLRANPGRSIHYVAGEVDADAREHIRQIMMQEQNAIVVASDGTFAQGVDIPSLQNVILASPGKGRIRLLQSIGRGLRRTNGKSECTVFDISDDLSWRRWKNFSLRHLTERTKIYNQERFPYRIYRVALKNA